MCGTRQPPSPPRAGVPAAAGIPVGALTWCTAGSPRRHRRRRRRRRSDANVTRAGCDRSAGCPPADPPRRHRGAARRGRGPGEGRAREMHGRGDVTKALSGPSGTVRENNSCFRDRRRRRPGYRRIPSTHTERSRNDGRTVRVCRR